MMQQKVYGTEILNTPLTNDRCKEFKCERKRLETFRGWLNRYPVREHLAHYGFIYLNSADRVQCVFCKVVLCDWKRRHNPLQRHAETSPDCPFLRGLNVGNIPLQREYNTVRLYRYDGKKWKAPSNMNETSKRLDSFQNWPHQVYLDKNEFVHSGLYFTGIEDCVKCFSCNVEMYDWDLNDDPMLYHELFSPECEYLKTINFPRPLDNENDFYKTKIHRLDSFENWNCLWKYPQDPSALATQGFFYNENRDVVQCVFCGVIITEWNDDESVIEKHVKVSYKCPFLLGRPVGNKDRDLAQQIKSTNSYSNAEMKDEEKRRETFKTWPYFGIDTRELAHVGFYYIGKRDLVKCFKCDGVLGDWSRYDNPWVEHQRHFPKCDYVKMMNCFRREGTGAYFYKVLNPYTPIEEDYKPKKGHDDDTCKLCQSGDLNTLFEPCCHLVSCEDCSLKLFKCPHPVWRVYIPAHVLRWIIRIWTLLVERWKKNYFGSYIVKRTTAERMVRVIVAIHPGFHLPELSLQCKINETTFTLDVQSNEIIFETNLIVDNAEEWFTIMGFEQTRPGEWRMDEVPSLEMWIWAATRLLSKVHLGPLLKNDDLLEKKKEE
ncbi:e3 ubiquitin-protein ligase XIAP [Caerostris darwini]|uniref:E3 ubiquitin-protein ligase XIAP n=1 Tax=Caerostris darwini TaxID=1538125 RepID=A0AAV4Q3T0_9ARAC|nr:e3 ubiquitin-protein ligase XIAP [Caerostris darwini]